ncbi:hypothetical protein HDU79_007947 [Rhizoclosmatium sp. JEL0117]|nr:hypothetical protein HDU79_007947 [Rhizoclosmatium sp. JEL0117]
MRNLKCDKNKDKDKDKDNDTDDDDRTTAGYNSQDDLLLPPAVYVPSTPPHQIAAKRKTRSEDSPSWSPSPEFSQHQRKIKRQRRDPGPIIQTRQISDSPLRGKTQNSLRVLLADEEKSSDNENDDEESDTEALFLPLMSRMRSYKLENQDLKRQLALLENLMREKDADAKVKEDESQRMKASLDTILREKDNKLKDLEKTNQFLSQRVEQAVQCTQGPSASGQPSILCHGCKITLF